MTPEMKKAGYDPNFSAAVNIFFRHYRHDDTSGVMFLIVYSGEWWSLCIRLVYGWLSTGNSYGSGDHDRSRYVCRTKGVSGWRTCSVLGGDKGYYFSGAIPSLMLLVIVIGGILAGLFTATEASAIAVLYALILSFYL